MPVSSKGLITENGGVYTLRFERHLDYPVSRVWDALIQPASLVKWLAGAKVDPRPGGEFILEFAGGSVSKGKITRYREQELLEYSWHEGQEGDSQVCWELFPEGPERCRLVLTHTRLTQHVPDFGAGWHTHLDLLAEVLSGRRNSWTWDEEWWRSKLPMYTDGI